ncbi:hypothetical protein BHM03_00053657 [Ensete ventricosum]|nr:hypothetical protein BHM03_00053657 [Ensete ventricosum]
MSAGSSVANKPEGAAGSFSQVEALFQRRIEFHRARKPYSSFSSPDGDFRLETLNPSSGPDRSGVSAAAAAAASSRSGEGRFYEHGLDPELSFRITFRRIVSHTTGFCAMCALQNHVITALQSSGKILSPSHLVKNLRLEQLDGGQRQYQCQRCKEKVRALKQLTIHKAPYVLTIHLKRFGSHVPGQKIDKNDVNKDSVVEKAISKASCENGAPFIPQSGRSDSEKCHCSGGSNGVVKSGVFVAQPRNSGCPDPESQKHEIKLIKERDAVKATENVSVHKLSHLEHSCSGLIKADNAKNMERGKYSNGESLNVAGGGEELKSIKNAVLDPNQLPRTCLDTAENVLSSRVTDADDKLLPQHDFLKLMMGGLKETTGRYLH